MYLIPFYIFTEEIEVVELCLGSIFWVGDTIGFWFRVVIIDAELRATLNNSVVTING